MNCECNKCPCEEHTYNEKKCNDCMSGNHLKQYYVSYGHSLLKRNYQDAKIEGIQMIRDDIIHGNDDPMAYNIKEF